MEDENLSPVKSNTVEGNVKQNQGRKSGIKDDILKCDACEYKCKKDETLIKHKNTKHESNTCHKGNLKCDNAKHVHKNVADDQSDDSTYIDKCKTSKGIEHEKLRNLKEGRLRCFKCGYFLFTEDNTENLVKPSYFAKSAHF